jgi:hypothetical protein
LHRAQLLFFFFFCFFFFVFFFFFFFFFLEIFTTAMKTLNSIWFVCCHVSLAFAATCTYMPKATTFEYGIDCAAGLIELVEGTGLRLACPNGGSDTAGIWLQSKELEAKTFSSEAAFVAWRAPLTDRRVALQVLREASVVAYAAHQPQPALLGSPSLLAVNNSDVERWVDLGKDGMWQAGSLTGGFNSGVSKVVVSAKAKSAEGLVKTVEATTLTATNGTFRVRFELTAAAVSTEAFEVILTSFAGAGWGGAIFETLTCAAAATSVDSAATTTTVVGSTIPDTDTASTASAIVADARTALMTFAVCAFALCNLLF